MTNGPVHHVGMGPARALLLDLDGVVRDWPDDLDGDRLGGLEPEAVRAALFEPELLHRAVTGVITDEAWQLEAAEHLRDAHGVDCAAALLEARSYPGRVRRKALALARRARRNVPVCLATNATSRLDEHLAALELSREFDYVFNSSELGFAKPDARIFEHACTALNLRTSEVVFVDDSQEHVDAAAALGLRSHRFTSDEAFARILILESVLD
jgi:putative hydrolase of the HAD superfamily